MPLKIDLDGLLNFVKQLAALEGTGKVTIDLSGEAKAGSSITLTKDAQGHLGGSITWIF